jgi:hypothetical protein
MPVGARGVVVARGRVGIPACVASGKRGLSVMVGAAAVKRRVGTGVAVGNLVLVALASDRVAEGPLVSVTVGIAVVGEMVAGAGAVGVINPPIPSGKASR